MGGVDLIDRMISYYHMSALTQKWTMRSGTDLALANSWLLYHKDLTTCGAPRKSIMQFLEFRMEVARTFLAQHHSQEDDADFPELSEGEDDSTQGKKCPVMAVPHVSVRRKTNAHLPELISLKNAARCRAAGCTGRTRPLDLCTPERTMLMAEDMVLHQPDLLPAKVYKIDSGGVEAPVICYRWRCRQTHLLAISISHVFKDGAPVCQHWRVIVPIVVSVLSCWSEECAGPDDHVGAALELTLRPGRLDECFPSGPGELSN
ncbi:hypothetical protein D4764_05G0010810 [Takifugu flavidus]|uniref:Uncharacterized protein n=1 Tax=Takifugu flavidus TaxID=433684 RepID=A0A5C6N3R0_9TELE|nr:hypothetical protein D4764_05G0010810 [Takifugu flavidus]